METESVNFTKQYTSNQRYMLTDLVLKQDTNKDESQYMNINEPIDLTSRNRSVSDNSNQPKLHKKHRRTRLAFSRQHENWSDAKWSKVLFSDFISDHQIVVKKYGGAGWGSVMVWAGITSEARTDLVIVDGDFITDQRHKTTILEEHVIPFAPFIGPNFIFMDDNTRPHPARIANPYLEEVFNPNLFNNPETIRFFTHEVPSRRHRKRKEFSIDPYLNTLENHFQNSSSKQEEVLKAARSLFSKRTRTLYHWMYPNAPKQQIKSAVATSWDSLGMQEKEFYISQVLGRFGFPPCSLMINPQLGEIKELPPLPSTQDFISSSSTELQNAISSISESSNHTGSTNNIEYEKLQMKKKKGRPFGSKNKKSKYDVRTVSSQEFNDDPELKKELEQFALFMYDERFK